MYDVHCMYVCVYPGTVQYVWYCMLYMCTYCSTWRSGLPVTDATMVTKMFAVPGPSNIPSGTVHVLIIWLLIVCFFSLFGILTWIRSGDAVRNAMDLFDVKLDSTFLLFRWTCVLNIAHSWLYSWPCCPFAFAYAHAMGLCPQQAQAEAQGLSHVLGARFLWISVPRNRE